MKKNVHIPAIFAGNTYNVFHIWISKIILLLSKIIFNRQFLKCRFIQLTNFPVKYNIRLDLCNIIP